MTAVNVTSSTQVTPSRHNLNIKAVTPQSRFDSKVSSNRFELSLAVTIARR